MYCWDVMLGQRAQIFRMHLLVGRFPLGKINSQETLKLREYLINIYSVQTAQCAMQLCCMHYTWGFLIIAV
jgi:hypothetical protein